MISEDDESALPEENAGISMIVQARVRAAHMRVIAGGVVEV